jgi:hypothetical protein
MALNLGGPGDRQDADGTLWLAYPRPVPGRETGLDLKLNLNEKFHKGGEFLSRKSLDADAVGGPAPWLGASAAHGLSSLSVPLLGKGDAPARYTVRLFFAEPEEDARPGSRVFDVALQGKVVLQNLDIAAAAGGPQRILVREIKDVDVTDNLIIELTPRSGRMPLLNAVDVVRKE